MSYHPCITISAHLGLIDVFNGRTIFKMSAFASYTALKLSSIRQINLASQSVSEPSQSVRQPQEDIVARTRRHLPNMNTKGNAWAESKENKHNAHERLSSEEKVLAVFSREYQYDFFQALAITFF
jgi:hypothetical protein